jgi:exopolysaccharide/PEP-CTERM locus tyrosine autokinase
MSIIEKAARRLEELNRAGVAVPWSAAGITEAEARALSALSGAKVDGAATSASDAARESSLRIIANAEPVASDSLKRDQAIRPSAAKQSREVALDLAALADAGYLVPGQPRSALADEFRGIKRPVLKNVHGQSAIPIHRSNLILITSAAPGEGKTFCAINMALSIASEVDTSVLLVDSDVVRPSLLSRLGVEVDLPGLLDLLTQEDLDVADTMLRTNVPKLSLLPAGLPRINSTELLASAAMDRLLDDLSQRYSDRVIIFDAPPLLATTESKVLASRMGQIVVVVDESQSDPKQVGLAFAALDSMPVVMSVLNRSTRRTNSPPYAYYEA